MAQFGKGFALGACRTCRILQQINAKFYDFVALYGVCKVKIVLNARFLSLKRAIGLKSKPDKLLAFFLLFSGICHAQEYPVITRLVNRDSGFSQFIADVRENRRRVFNLNKNDENSVRAVAEHLTIYQYTYAPRYADENILSLASSCTIPYSTLATLNRLGNSSSIEAGNPILLPSMPGLFIPESPESGLELLMASNMEQIEAYPVRLTIRNPADGTSTVFYFLPGAEFSSTERAFFLNPGFNFPLRNFSFPLHNYTRQTSGFGSRQNPITGRSEFHGGIDLAASAGTEVYSVGGGTVIETGYSRIYGNFVKIRHEGNWVSMYGHLQSIATTQNASVRSGTLIGYVGSTGLSTGPHLHFELHQNGTPQNPNDHLPSGRR